MPQLSSIVDRVATTLNVEYGVGRVIKLPSNERSEYRLISPPMAIPAETQMKPH